MNCFWLKIKTIIIILMKYGQRGWDQDLTIVMKYVIDQFIYLIWFQSCIKTEIIY